MKRTKLFFAFLLVFLPLAVLTSAPAPKDTIRLTPAGTVNVDKLVVHDAALIDDDRIVIVGRQKDAEDFNVPDPDGGVPNGAIIDLAKKSAERFTNGHTTQIWSVSSYGGRVVSGSIRFEKALLRSWDLKTQETKELVKLDHISSVYRLRCFRKSGRLVVDATELVVLDPAKPRERTELACPPGVKFLSDPLAVSPDDAWIACTGSEDDQIVCFQAATKKAAVVRVSPKDAGQKWRVYAFAFSPSGKLFVCRHGTNSDEVPKGKAEKDVPAARRGIVRIDLPEGKVVPLNMGHTNGTWGCAVEGKETWLATVGTSRPDKPKPNGNLVAGELRVYNLASGKLAYREQLEGDSEPAWVRFTPSGKRLVCVTTDGTVRWWDVPVR